MKLIKVSDNPNLELKWDMSKLDEIRIKFPDVHIVKRKNGAGIDKDEDLPIPVIGNGRGMRFLIPFFDDPRFARTASGCMARCLNYYFGYTLEEWWCQMVYGDRNLRPLDEDTNKIPRFAGVLKGFFESSCHSSQTKKVNRRYIWNKENKDRNKIICAANMKMNKYDRCKFYFAKLKTSNNLKLGFTSFERIEDRYEARGQKSDHYFDSIVEIVEGPGNDIILLERDTKLKFNLPDEEFNPSLAKDILDYVYSYNNPEFNYQDREQVMKFICR